MAVAVIGGLLVSTALSLLVVPAFYVVADRAVTRLRRKRRPHETESEAAGAGREATSTP